MSEPLIVRVIHKTCTRCGETKTLELFAKNLKAKDGTKSWCKACMVDSSKAWAQANPERSRENRRNYARRTSAQKKDYRAWLRYGVPREVARKLYDSPCHLCGEYKPKINIDHCHETGRVRGALCNRCNVAIHILDDADRRDKAMAYIASGKDFRDG